MTDFLKALSLTILVLSPLGRPGSAIGQGGSPARTGQAVGVASRPAKDDYLVGVDYFCGWWREQPNKYAPHGTDWRTQYPGRAPLLGEYNEQATMDAEIKTAAEYGVDFFQILWYPLTGVA